MLEIKELGKLESIFLAEYIAERTGSLSHLKLQKLLFYVEAYHLAYFDKSIIEDDFEAWVHGPVCRKVYNEVKDHSLLYNEVSYIKGDAQHTPKEIIGGKITKDQLDYINEVIDTLNPYTHSELENFTHSELPWIEARKGLNESDKSTKLISKETMRTFYKAELYGENAEDTEA